MKSADRFWENIDRSIGDCWNWLGSLDRDGYGRVRYNGRRTRAHRIAYELAIGPIPAGLVIDHLCRNRRCVNPDHLEPVTSQENTRRGVTGQARAEQKRAQTHCEHGHEFTEANTAYRLTGGRKCKECHRLREAERRKAKP